jgi:integrase
MPSRSCERAGWTVTIFRLRADTEVSPTGGASDAQRGARKLAKVPHYHPHDLRHRRLTIWHQAGVPAREVAHRAGHARTSESLDTYSHVMPLDEMPSERVEGLFSNVVGG